jgi:hypothetical protein
VKREAGHSEGASTLEHLATEAQISTDSRDCDVLFFCLVPCAFVGACAWLLCPVRLWVRVSVPWGRGVGVGVGTGGERWVAKGGGLAKWQVAFRPERSSTERLMRARDYCTTGVGWVMSQEAVCGGSKE